MRKLHELSAFDAKSVAILGGAAALFTAATIGTLRTAPEYKELAVDCGQDPAAGSIFDLNVQKFPTRLELQLQDGQYKQKVFVSTYGGHLVVNGSEVSPNEAGKRLVTFGNGTHLIAGAPTPQKLDGYYAGDEAFTLACKEATPESVARSEAAMIAATS